VAVGTRLDLSYHVGESLVFEDSIAFRAFCALIPRPIGHNQCHGKNTGDGVAGCGWRDIQMWGSEEEKHPDTEGHEKSE